MGIKEANDKLVILGGGGHAASVMSAILDKQRIVGVLDNPKDDSKIDELLRNGLQYFHVAIGDNTIRQKKTEECIRKGLSPITIIDKTAAIDSEAVIGQGCFIGKNAVVNARVVIGQNCIINSGAIIEHDCKVMDNTHCAPGSVLCGNVSVGRSCLIGANATIIPGVKIVDHVTVGAGSVVTDDLEMAGTYVGSPAKLLAKKESR